MALIGADLGENTIANLGYEHMIHAIHAHWVPGTCKSPRNRCLLLDGLAMDYCAMTGAIVSEMFVRECAK